LNLTISPELAVHSLFQTENLISRAHESSYAYPLQRAEPLAEGVSSPCCCLLPSVGSGDQDRLHRWNLSGCV